MAVVPIHSRSSPTRCRATRPAAAAVVPATSTLSYAWPMPYGTAVSLFVIALAVAIAPLCSEALGRWRIPSVLFELLLGVLIGPEVLAWATTGPFVNGLDALGLSFLFFMAGYEIDFSRLAGAPLKLGILGWLTSLVLGLGVGLVLLLTDFAISSLLVGLALTTTAIGTLLPMLRDRHMLDSPFGKYLVAAGSAGEFGPVVAVTVLLGAARPAAEMLLLLAFVALAVGVAFVAARPQPPRVVETLQRHLGTSTQLPVRIVLLLITGLVLVASSLSLEVLLGAFAAGLIVRVAFTEDQADAMQPRLESIGFGFLIPVFFVVSGMQFQVRALLSDLSTVERLLVFVGLFLVVRGLPALFVYARTLAWRQRAAIGVLQSTALPLLVVITRVGLATHHMRPTNATALVGAGMVSVLVFPLAGFALAGRGAEGAATEVDDRSGYDGVVEGI
jgi:Kef-type K+ transport system membrane component KefB